MKSRKSSDYIKNFQVDKNQQRISDIKMTLAEFEYMVSDLDRQIKDEENSFGIFDVESYAYPSFAKAARQRRDNLLASIQNLQEQLSCVNSELASVNEKLKDIEMLEERGHAKEKTLAPVILQDSNY